MALDIEFEPLEVADNVQIVSKNTLAEIPVTSSGELTLLLLLLLLLLLF
jgi:predicted metallopeptidase